MTPEPRAAARAVLEHPDPLVLVDAALRTTLGGDIRPPMITYLAATTRLLELRPGTMPCHALVQGPPSVGKTATLTAVRRLLPLEAVVVIEAGSPHVLIYGNSTCATRPCSSARPTACRRARTIRPRARSATS
jgi:hypothetical protein